MHLSADSNLSGVVHRSRITQKKADQGIRKPYRKDAEALLVTKSGLISPAEAIQRKALCFEDAVIEWPSGFNGNLRKRAIDSKGAKGQVGDVVKAGVRHTTLCTAGKNVIVAGTACARLCNVQHRKKHSARRYLYDKEAPINITKPSMRRTKIGIR